MAFFKKLRRFASLLLVFLMLSTANVSAEQTLRQLYDQGIYFVTPLSLIDSCNTDGSANVSSYTAVGKRIFYIGDSITLGMTNNGLLNQTAEAGIIVNTDNGLTRDAGGNPTLVTSSAEVTNGVRVSRVLEKLKQRADPDSTGDPNRLKQADFGSDKADVIVVALGTNQESDFRSKVVDLLKYLRSANAGAKIFWVKTNFTSGATGSSANVNTEIQAAIDLLASEGDTNLGTIDPNNGSGLAPNAGDGRHFTGSGYARLAEFIVRNLVEDQTISGPASDPPSNMSAEDRGRYVWSYLVNEKRLPPNAAAGVMGNLNSESGGFNPHNVQNSANGFGGVPDQPEIPIDALVNRLNPKTRTVEKVPFKGHYGYGIAQWTTASRQESFLSHSLGGGEAPFDVPRSTGNLRYQLDYMWFELESKYFDDVLAVLKDPDVSIKTASDKFLDDFESPRIKNFEERERKSEEMLALYSGSSFTPSTASDCVSSPSTGEASKYIPDCGANNGNAAIACTAINQLMEVPYDQAKRAGPTDPNPKFLDCSAFVGMAIYRAFHVDLGGICSIEYLSNKNFEVITDLRSIQPGDIVGRGTICGQNEDGVFGHVGIVVSYDPEEKKLVTVETGSTRWLSGIRGIPGSYTPRLSTDHNNPDPTSDYSWAVRYIGNKTLQPGAN